MYRSADYVVDAVMNEALKKGINLDPKKVKTAVAEDGDPYPDDAMCAQLFSTDVPSRLKSFYSNLWEVLSKELDKLYLQQTQW